MRQRRPSKEAVAVFTEFYDTDAASRAYGAEKLRSGTANLTPETLAFMRGALSERRAVQARERALADAVAQERADDLAKLAPKRRRGRGVS